MMIYRNFPKTVFVILFFIGFLSGIDFCLAQPSLNDPFVIRIASPAGNNTHFFRLDAGDKSKSVAWVDVANAGDNGTSQIKNHAGMSTTNYVSFSSKSYPRQIRLSFPKILLMYSFTYNMPLGLAVDAENLIALEKWGGVRWLSTRGMFEGCRFFLEATDVPDFSNVLDFSFMFFNSQVGFLSNNLSNWQMPKVRNMNSMFQNHSYYGAPKPFPDISAWDVSSVQNMSSMFEGCRYFNVDISGWNVSNVQNMANMFYGSNIFNQPIGKWDVSEVRNMRDMFNGATAFNQNLGNWTFHPDVITTGMFNNSGMDCDNYSLSLIGWASNPNNPNNIQIHMPGVGYSAAAALARDYLINQKGWIITGDFPDFSNCGSEYVTEWSLPAWVSSISFNRSNPAGDVQYYWHTVPFGSGGGNGVIPSGSGAFTLSGLPSGQQIKLYLVPTHLQRFFIQNGPSKTHLTAVSQWGKAKWTSMADAFDGCINLQVTATDLPKLDNCLSMDRMFRHCSSMDGPSNINLWDISAVLSINSTFNGATSFNQSINSWNTSNVKSMESTFANASIFNQPLNSWNTGNVTTMANLFNGASSFNQPLNNWNTWKVTNMNQMFFNASSYNQPIGSWNVTSVTNAGSMFQGATYFNQPLNAWQTASFTVMSGMFEGVTYFNQPLNNWNVSNVTTFESMFSGATSFNQSLDSWDVSQATGMLRMFENASTFNHSLATWTFRPGVLLTDFLKNSGMSCVNYDHSLDGWLKNPLSPNGINIGVGGLIYDILSEEKRNALVSQKNWNFNGDIRSSDICRDDFITIWELPSNQGTISFNRQAVSSGVDYYWETIPFGTAGTGNLGAGDGPVTISGLPQGSRVRLFLRPEHLRRFYINDGVDKEILVDIQAWGEVPWASMQDAFYGCSNINVSASDLPNLNNTMSLNNMFRDCTNLTGPSNINQWNVSNIRTMAGMFKNASLFNQPLSAWNTSLVQVMNAMFENATSFNQALSSWQVDEVYLMIEMFKNASAFNSPIATWNTSSVTNMTGMFMGAQSFNQPINAWDVSNVEWTIDMFKDAVSFNRPLVSWNTSAVRFFGGMFNGASSFNQPLDSWDLSSAVTLAGMLDNSGLDCRNYGQTLRGWAMNSATPGNLLFSAAGLTFPLEFLSDRQTLVDNGWMIADAGVDDSCSDTDLFDNAFVTVWRSGEMGGVSNNSQILIPGIGTNYLIFWRTNFSHTNSGFVTGNGHTLVNFPTSGDYEVFIIANDGTFTGMQFADGGDKMKLREIKQWGNISWSSLEQAFKGCSRMYSTAIDYPDVSQVKSMREAFRGCEWFSGDQGFSQWDVSSVEDLSAMFMETPNFVSNISTWDVGSVRNMDSMFHSVTFYNQPMNNWLTHKVESMTEMFANAEAFNQPIGKWDTRKVERMNGLFLNAKSFDQDLDTWDVSSVTDMNRMFKGTESFNRSLSNWNVGNVTNMTAMFHTSRMAGDVNSWDVSQVTDMDSMFFQAFYFDQSISNWDIAQVSSLNMFLEGAALDCRTYGDVLKAWAERPSTPSNIHLDAGFLRHGAEVNFSKKVLTAKGWTINDEGTEFTCSDSSFIKSTFVTKWNPTLPGISASNQIIIPAIGEDFDIYWVNDIEPTSGYLLGKGETTITFDLFGSFIIFISPGEGTFEGLRFTDDSDRLKLTEVLNWGDIKWNHLDSAFYGTSNLNLLAEDIPDFSDLESMAYTFAGSGISSNPLMADWNTASITNMEGLFHNATQFNQPIVNWNVGNVENMKSLLKGATSFNQPLNSWNTSSVITFESIFEGASQFDQPIGDWNTSRVSNLASAFKNATAFNQNINSWDVSNVVDMSSIFEGALSFNEVLDNWDTRSVLSMDNAFKNANSFDQDLNDWQTRNVRNMEGIFRNASSFNHSIRDWDTRNLQNISYAFSGAALFNQDLSAWQTGNVTNMQAAFSNSSSFNQSLGSWDVSKVESFSSCFEGALSFNQDLSSWNIAAATDLSRMFNGAKAFNQPLNNWNVEGVLNFENMLSGASSFNQVLDEWTFNKMANLNGMLDGTGMNCELYGQSLAKWAGNSATPDDLTLGANGLQHGSEVSAVKNLLQDKGWTIHDAGVNADCNCAPWYEAVQIRVCSPLDTGNFTITGSTWFGCDSITQVYAFFNDSFV